MADRWRDLKGLTQESRVWYLNHMLKPDLRDTLEAALKDTDTVAKQLQRKKKEDDRLAKQLEMKEKERREGDMELVNEGKSSSQSKVKAEGTCQSSKLKGQSQNNDHASQSFPALKVKEQRGRTKRKTSFEESEESKRAQVQPIDRIKATSLANKDEDTEDDDELYIKSEDGVNLKTSTENANVDGRSVATRILSPSNCEATGLSRRIPQSVAVNALQHPPIKKVLWVPGLNIIFGSRKSIQLLPTQVKIRLEQLWRLSLAELRLTEAWHDLMKHLPREYRSQSCVINDFLTDQPVGLKRNWTETRVETDGPRADVVCIHAGRPCGYIVVHKDIVKLGFVPLPLRLRRGIVREELGFWVKE